MQFQKKNKLGIKFNQNKEDISQNNYLKNTWDRFL